MRPTLLLICVALLASLPCSATTLDWQEATVVRLASQPTGTSAAIVPIGNVLYGVSSTNTNSWYWIRLDKMTYVVPNYSNGAWVHRWLILTIGGKNKAAVDGKNLRIVDDEGKERQVKIIAKMTNEVADAPPPSGVSRDKATGATQQAGVR